MNNNGTAEIVKELLARTDKVCFVYDVDAHELLYLNKEFESLWNRSSESIKADPGSLLDTVHPEDRELISRRYNDLLNGIILKEVEFRIIRPDQSVRWLLLSPHLVKNEQGRRCITGLAEDITLKRENAETLHKYASKKNSVLEILSHDLAGSLGMIQSLTGLLAETVQGYENAEANNIIRIIQESSMKSLQLIRDFVQQEFLESANAGLVKKRVDLVRKLQEVVEQYREGEALIKKEMKLIVSEEPVFVNMDENKFMQVINNLISNSIKFTHDGGVITVQVEEKESTVIITVKDNGIGIPEKYHDEIYDKFTRARREGLKGEPSTGLGMSIIKTIVEWHNGNIWFESKPNVGTTFYIEIPKN